MITQGSPMPAGIIAPPGPKSKQHKLLKKKINAGHQRKTGAKTSKLPTCPPNYPVPNPINNLWNAQDKQVQFKELAPMPCKPMPPKRSAANILVPDTTAHP